MNNHRSWYPLRCVKDIVGVSDWSSCVEASDIQLLLRTEDINHAKQGWQENATRSRNRTEAISLLEMAHALGSQAASLESDRVRNLDKNVLASAVAEKGTWFRHVVTGIQEKGTCPVRVRCRGLHSTDEWDMSHGRTHHDTHHQSVL